MKVSDAELIVLDNSPAGIEYLKTRADEYFHIPEVDNVAKMFNWYLDNGNPADDEIFYNDDDIEISVDLIPKMREALTQGYDCVKVCSCYVTDVKAGKSAIWNRKAKHITAAWMASRHLWKKGRFREDLVDGGILYFTALNDFNCRFLFEPLINYMIHDDNLVMKRSMYKFTLDLVSL